MANTETLQVQFDSFINKETGAEFRFSVEDFCGQIVVYQDDIEGGEVINSTPIFGGFYNEDEAETRIQVEIDEGIAAGHFQPIG